MDYSIHPQTAQPRYSRPGQPEIDLQVKFPALGPTPVWFTASPNDSAAHGREIHARALQGEFGPIAPAAAEPPLPPDWRGFLLAVKGTTIYQGLQEAAGLDLAANAIATELRLLLGEAALGMPDTAAIQEKLALIAAGLAPEDLQEIGGLIEAYLIPLALEAPLPAPEEAVD